MELIEKIVQILQIWSLGKSPTSKIFLFTSTKVQSAEKMNSKKNVPIKYMKYIVSIVNKISFLEPKRLAFIQFKVLT